MTIVLQERRSADRRQRTVGVALIAALSAVDVLTSSWLRSRHGTELNPVAGWLITNGLLGVAKAVAVGSVAVLLQKARPASWTMSAVWFVAGIYTAVIGLHLWQLGS